MAPLSPQARALIQEGRSALRPNAAERTRLEAALDALGPTPAPPRIPRGGPWRVFTPIAIGVALAAGAALLRTNSHPTSASPPARSSVATSASALEPSPEPRPLAPSTSGSTPSPSPSPPAASTRKAANASEDELSQEVGLLSRAANALRTGRAAEALQLIKEHERRFPTGTLRLERRAVKAQALCSLKRVTEGRAELARLALNSPAAARAKEICDAASEPSR